MVEADCYKSLIASCETPIVFHRHLNWDLLKWRFEDWYSAFGDEKFAFRCADRVCRKSPLWENLCRVEYHTMSEFHRFCTDAEGIRERWMYFDYKHIPEFFKDKKHLFESVSWSEFGFPERDSSSSTIWIGSRGAHTPCHLDSYGFNLVAQVYGKKRWILFPPSESDNLKPTRVPYEESSVYSMTNFSCYRSIRDKHFQNCYLIDLYPGDVLYVPARWWHYVENLSTAISINTWIPHKNDDDWRLEEALVRYLLSCTVKDLPDEEKHAILNLNEIDIENSSTILKILNCCKENCNKRTHNPDPEPTTDGEPFLNQCHVHRYKHVPQVSEKLVKSLIEEASSCTDLSSRLQEDTDDNLLTSVVNAFCHPDVIANVKSRLMKE